MRTRIINKKTIKKGRIVLLRADFNVPVKNGKIVDDFKIMRTLPTIDFLLDNGNKIIVMTHLGGGGKKIASTRPLAVFLKKKGYKNILFLNNLLDPGNKEKIKKSKADIILLENLRSQPGEESNDRDFARMLSELGDVYVNDAFGVSHRRHASVSAIKEFIPSFAGLLLSEEINNLNKILKPKQPLVAILGGAKIGTKLPLIKKLSQKAKYILVGGGIANNFFATRGFDIGSSLVEKDLMDETKKLDSDKIILPLDIITAPKAGSKKIEIRLPGKISRNYAVFDIGPKSIGHFSTYIKTAATIIWNGPLGYFENEKFKHGTLSIGRSIASRSRGKAFAVIGGGETVEAARTTKMMDYIDWVSTGGGAMLSYLSEEEMPGLEGLLISRSKSK
jgi:phosphoglycerate kinase